MNENISKLEIIRAKQQISLHAKISPGCLLVSSINPVNTKIIMYIYSTLRLLGRFTTCLAQTTTASRLLFALGWHFMPQECEKY